MITMSRRPRELCDCNGGPEAPAVTGGSVLRMMSGTARGMRVRCKDVDRSERAGTTARTGPAIYIALAAYFAKTVRVSLYTPKRKLRPRNRATYKFNAASASTCCNACMNRVDGKCMELAILRPFSRASRLASRRCERMHMDRRSLQRLCRSARCDRGRRRPPVVVARYRACARRHDKIIAL